MGVKGIILKMVEVFKILGFRNGRKEVVVGIRDGCWRGNRVIVFYFKMFFFSRVFF